MTGRALASIARTTDDRVIKQGRQRLLKLGLAPKGLALPERFRHRTGLARHTDSRSW